MAFQLEWHLEGEKQLSRVLNEVKLAAKDWYAPLGRAAFALKKTFSEDVFKTRGAAIGESWRPLSPVTIARKARKGQPSDPLIATGKMKRSFKADVFPDHAVISNPTLYFRFHQSNQPRSHLPRRAMMRLGHQQREMVVKEFQREWLRKLGRNV